MTTARWSPFAIRDGRLTLGRRAIYAPDGLVVRDRTYGWDDVGRMEGLGYLVTDGWGSLPVAGWALEMTPDPRPGPDLLLVATGTAPPRFVRLVMNSWLPRVEAAMALAAYLRTERAARSALADPTRMNALLDALRSTLSDEPRLSGMPLMGDKYDLHVAVARGYHEALSRHYGGRRVDVDPPVDVDEVVRRPGTRCGSACATGSRMTRSRTLPAGWSSGARGRSQS